MSYSNLYTTNSIPRALYGRSENNNVSMEINAGGITIGADLLTTPFYGVISAAGISTTNPLGFNLLSTTNFNDQALTNIGSESFYAGISITDACNNSIITNTTNGNMTINCATNQVYLNSHDNTTINTGADFRVFANNKIVLVAINDNMSLQADDGISITSLKSGLVLTSGDGTTGTPDIILDAPIAGDINLRSTNGNIILDGNVILNGSLDIFLSININFNGFNANAVGDINYLADIGIYDKANIISSSHGSSIVSNNSGNLSLFSANNIIMNSPTTQINMPSNNSSLVINGNAVLTGSTNPTFGDDIYTYILDPQNSLSIKYNNGNIGYDTQSVLTTTTLKVGENTNDGSINGSIYCNTIQTTNINSLTSVNIQTGGGEVIQMNSGDNTQLYCGENFFVQTNTTSGVTFFNTGDLSNGGGVKWNNYPISITFVNRWSGGFFYPQTGTNNWEVAKTQNIGFPTSFLSGNWAVSFSVNCWNVGSDPGDKGLAIFLDFLDGNSISYTGFSYNQSTPYAQHFNTSTYTASAQNPMNITYTDYFDFTGAINDLTLQLNWYANQSQTQNFNVVTTFTLMTLI